MESPEEIDREAARCKDEKKKADTFVLWRQVSTGWQFNWLKKQLGGLLGAYLGAYSGAFPV